MGLSPAVELEPVKERAEKGKEMLGMEVVTTTRIKSEPGEDVGTFPKVEEVRSRGALMAARCKLEKKGREVEVALGALDMNLRK